MQCIAFTVHHLSQDCFGKKEYPVTTSNIVYSTYSNYMQIMWCIDVSTWLAEISLSAVIVVGYNQTNVNVFEADRQAELIVTINEPAQVDPIETSFYLLVNTQDGTATGLQ